MLAIQFIRDNADRVRASTRDKGEDPGIVDRVLELDARRLEKLQQRELLAAEQNRLGKAVGPAIGAARAAGTPTDVIPELVRLEALKAELHAVDEAMRVLDTDLDDLLGRVPNIFDPSVPVAPDDTGNVEVRTWKTKPDFGFTPRTHYDIGEALGVINFERAARVAGSRFAYLVGGAAHLERALVQFMLDTHTRRHGFTEVQPPFLVNSAAMFGTANLPKFGDEAFRIADRDLWLVPTAEVPITNMYAGEVLDGASLPIRHVAYSPCFRSEAGAAGKDTRGYIRLHQFNKVEMVSFTRPEDSMAELDHVISAAETILQELGLHYRVLLMCSGDMGFAQYKKFDIEAWAPGLGRYLEVSSCSVFNDFQARRADIRFRPEAGAKPRFVHTLNGSGLALVRTVSAILETYQREDGSVAVPEVLIPYMGGATEVTRG